MLLPAEERGVASPDFQENKEIDPVPSAVSRSVKRWYVWWQLYSKRLLSLNLCSLSVWKMREKGEIVTVLVLLSTLFCFCFNLCPLEQYGASYSLSLAFPDNRETQRWFQPDAIWLSCCSSSLNCVLLLLKGSWVLCVSIRILFVYILFPSFQFSGVIIHVMVTDCSQELDWIRSHRTSSFNWIETTLYPGVSQWLMGGNLK